MAAKHSRVTSSTTLRTRKRYRLANWSCSKSSDQRALGCAATRIADVIAMILPVSLQKGSMQARLDRRYHLVSEMPLPAEPFRHGEALTQVNVVFQVWERRDYEWALPISATSHEDFVFVGSLEETHFVVRRVGARAGAILPVPAEAEVPRGYAPASNLFIRATGDPVLLEARFRCLEFGEVRGRAAAVPSVSKSDLVALYSAQRALDMARATAPDQVPVTSYVASAAASSSASPCGRPGRVRRHSCRAPASAWHSGGSGSARWACSTCRAKPRP